MSKDSGPREAASGRATPTNRRPATVDKLDRLLSEAAALMARKGFDQTTIRDVSQATGYSLAGMYYYFESKDDLLFLIQERTFTSLVEAQKEALALGGSAAERLGRLVRGHLSFFTEHSDELKVCTYELASLSSERYHEVERIRRRYYKLAAGVIAELLGRPPEAEHIDLTVRHATLFMFGMLNWVFMWFDPEIDEPVERTADRMIDLLLHGVPGMTVE